MSVFKSRWWEIKFVLKKSSMKIKLDEIDFLFISNLKFAGYTGSKNQVQTRQKIKFSQLDFSNLFFLCKYQVQINRGYVGIVIHKTFYCAKLLSNLYIGVHLKCTKKFGNKDINRQFFI